MTGDVLEYSIKSRSLAEYADAEERRRRSVVRRSAVNSRMHSLHNVLSYQIQERPAVADKPARRLRSDCTVYVRAVGL